MDLVREPIVPAKAPPSRASSQIVYNATRLFLPRLPFLEFIPSSEVKAKMSPLSA